MSNNLGRTEVSVSQTQKELAINNSDGVLDAAITSELTVSWSGADALKVLTTTQLRQNSTFVMSGSTSEVSPVLKMAAVQRGMVLVDNDLGVALTVTDDSTADEVTVAAGSLVAVYVTATGVKRIFDADAIVLPADTSTSVRVATTANITISTALNNGDTLDGIVLATNDRVLVKNQTSGDENGIYIVDAVPTRATDFDTGGTEVYAGVLVTVEEGTANADSLWILSTNNPITVGSTSLSFKKLSQTATQYATNAQVLAGTSLTRAVSPGRLASLWTKGSNIASAATLTIGNGRYFHVTGTTGITDIDWSDATDGREAVLTFDGILTLTHSATLDLPGAANITTAAGDRAAFIQDDTDTVYCIWYQKADGSALVASAGLTASTTTEVLQGTDTAVYVTPDALYALWGKGSAVASAATVSFDEGGYYHITGTTTINDFDFTTAKNGRMAVVVFDDVLTITYNATTLVLPGGASIVTAAGDTACFVQDSSDNVVCLWYQRADGTPITGASFSAATTTNVLTGTNTSRAVTPDALAALWEKGSDVASAATVSLGEGGFFHITGTTTITDIDWTTAKDGRAAYVTFDGVLTLTHNATTLKLPGSANITTAAGDRAIFVQDSSDNVICIGYFRANGKPVVPTTQVIAIAVSDETTSLTTGTAKTTFRMPFAFTLTDIRASVTTAPTGGTLLTVDVNENTGGGATTILSTKLTFDASEKTTTTAATPRVISDATLADDAEITIDIDAVGSTIAGAGLKVYLIGYPAS